MYIICKRYSKKVYTLYRNIRTGIYSVLDTIARYILAGSSGQVYSQFKTLWTGVYSVHEPLDRYILCTGPSEQVNTFYYFYYVNDPLVRNIICTIFWTIVYFVPSEQINTLCRILWPGIYSVLYPLDME